MKKINTSVAITPAGFYEADSILVHGSADAFYEAQKDNPDFNYYNEGAQRQEAMTRIYADAEKVKADADAAIAEQKAKDEAKAAEKAENETLRTVTEDDLVNNPVMKEQGIEVGDKISYQQYATAQEAQAAKNAGTGTKPSKPAKDGPKTADGEK